MNINTKMHELSDDIILSIKNNVLEFVSKNIQSKEASFYIGYGIHILTDIYWAKSLYLHFQKKYLEDKHPLQNERWAYYNDTDQLDFELYKICKWRNEVWSFLIKTHGIDAGDLVTATEITAWNNRTINWYNCGESQHKNPIKYISIDELFTFIDDTSNNIYKDFSLLL